MFFVLKKSSKNLTWYYTHGRFLTRNLQEATLFRAELADSAGTSVLKVVPDLPASDKLRGFVLAGVTPTLR